jgi:hypothetical protein
VLIIPKRDQPLKMTQHRSRLLREQKRVVG